MASSTYDDDKIDLAKSEAEAGSTTQGVGSSNPESLAKYERQVGRGYTSTPTQISWIKKRKKHFIFGGGGLAAIVAAIFGFSLISGPLQFIHLAQNLQGIHFSANEDAADGRFLKTMRFINSRDVKSTRMGVLGAKYARNVEASLLKAGLKPMYTPKLGYFDGFIIDPEHPNNVGKSRKQIIKEWEAKGVVVKEPRDIKGLSSEQKAAAGKGLVVAMSEQRSGFLAERQIAKSMLKEMGVKGIISAINFRAFAKYSGITLHPLKRLDRKINKTAAKAYTDWKDERSKRLKSGAEFRIDVKETASSSDDDSVKKDQAAKSAEAKKAIGNIKNLKGVGLKSLTSSAAVAGVVCLMRDMDKGAATIKQAQVILPLARSGMEMVALGNQVMSGEDIDTQQLGFYTRQLSGKDSSGKESSWSSARSIQAELGQKQTGLEPNQTLKTIAEGSPFSFINNIYGVDKVCSKFGKVVQGVIGVGLGILTGGVAQAFAQAVIQGVAINKAVDVAADWAAGEAVNVDAVGADFGNVINYGTRMTANGQAISSGGRALSENEELALKNSYLAFKNSEFQKKNLAYRLFNAQDSRSLVSKLIDNQPTQANQNLKSFASTIINFSNFLPKLINSVGFSHKVSAEGAYDYGFSKYGFSEQELNDRQFNNPMANAENAAKILSREKESIQKGSEYIKRAKNCFGVRLSQITGDDGQSVWDAQPQELPNPYNSAEYSAFKCDDSNKDWLSIRFFIFDTQVLKSYACYEGDSESCSQMGIGDDVSATSGSTTSAGTSIISGQAKELAQEIVDSNKVSGNSSYMSQVQAVANGDFSCNINPTILKLMVGVLRDGHSFHISSLNRKCTNTLTESGPSSYHYADGGGHAIDFSIVDGSVSTGSTSKDLNFIEDAFKYMPAGSGIGQSGCRPEGSLSIPAGIREFPDSCNHIHIEVPKENL